MWLCVPFLSFIQLKKLLLSLTWTGLQVDHSNLWRPNLSASSVRSCTAFWLVQQCLWCLKYALWSSSIQSLLYLVTDPSTDTVRESIASPQLDNVPNIEISTSNGAVCGAINVRLNNMIGCSSWTALPATGHWISINFGHHIIVTSVDLQVQRL